MFRILCNILHCFDAVRWPTKTAPGLEKLCYNNDPNGSISDEFYGNLACSAAALENGAITQTATVVNMRSSSLHCALSLAAQCIVIGPVCGFVCLCVCVCGSVTTITRNCVHRSSPNWVCR